MVSAGARTLLDAVRELDTRWQRRRAPDERRVLIDARTSMEYAMMAPVHRRLQQDPRIRVHLTSSERPGRLSAI
jgi:hypothetical protein